MISDQGDQELIIERLSTVQFIEQKQFVFSRNV